MEKRDSLVRDIETEQDETDPEIMKALARKKDDVETTKSEADMSPAEKARKEAQDLKKQIRAF
jgi:hypothetical protein